MSAQLKKKYTPAQYLALEEAARNRSEFWNGEIVAMSRRQHQPSANRCECFSPFGK